MDEENAISLEVNHDNFQDQLTACSKLLDEQNWDDFQVLYANLEKYQKTQMKGSDSTDQVNSWLDFYQKTIKDVVQLLEVITTFDEFEKNLRYLSNIVKDPRTLWKILHTNVNAQLKVTLHESQLIAAEFFTPEQLFEYGFDTFTDSSLCDFSNITNEEALIDIFYATVGFVRACNLPKTYVASLQQYGEFISKILTYFIQVPDFDSQRFVWLIEVIREHLHMNPQTLISICEKAITQYVQSETEKISTLNKLYKMCVISTSPFLQTLKIIPDSVDKIFQKVLYDQQIFLRKYILCSFASCDWTSHNQPMQSEPFKCWKLYFINLATKLSEKPELPNLLLVDLIEDSLMFFEGYYAEVQPTMERATALRMDLFGIIEAISQHAPTELSPNALKRAWYLLYICAVAGATDFDIANVKPAQKDESSAIMLGLDRYGSDFLDYRLALERLSKKFETEFANFQSMATFVRKNFRNNSQIPAPAPPPEPATPPPVE